MEVDSAVNERVAALRKALSLTQEEFAAGIKSSQSHIGAIELGQRRANDRFLKMIALTYGANEAWLKTGRGDMFPTPCEHKLSQVMSLFRKLDPLLQDYVLQQLDNLLEYQAKREGGNGE